MQLHWACKRGDLISIERQLKRGIQIDAPDHGGKTPLMYAAEGRLAGIATLDFLIKAGADVNAASTTLHETPLALAAKSGNPAKVRALLSAGANPCFVNRSGYTAITCITQSDDDGRLACLELLLRAGADPDQISQYGECPLRIAIHRGSLQAVRILLDHGASREPAGMTDCMWTILLGDDKDLARELRRGTDLTARNHWEMTPWLLSILTGDVAKAQLLFAAGAQRDDRGRCGQTNLMHSVLRSRAEMTSWLLQQGCDPNSTDDFGRTALMSAAQCGAAECARALLVGGANLHFEGPHVGPAMAECVNAEVARVLADAGGDINNVWAGYSLLMQAAERGDPEFVRALLDMGADVAATSTGATALHTAVAWDELEIVALLLAAGADPNACDVDLCTPLMSARSLECVDLLLTAGADVQAADQAATEVIAWHRDCEIVDRLLQAGANVEPANGSSGSPLLAAAQNGDVVLTEYLLDKRADINAATSWGLTPLMSAAERGHSEVIRLLLARGADITAVDDQRRTALFYAAAPEGFTSFKLAQESARRPSLANLAEMVPEMATLLLQLADQMPEDTAQLQSPNYGYLPSNDVAALEALVAAGADLEVRDDEGLTPLLLACRCGRPARVAALLRLKADHHVCDAKGNSASAQATQHHDPDQQHEIMRLLKNCT